MPISWSKSGSSWGTGRNKAKSPVNLSDPFPTAKASAEARDREALRRKKSAAKAEAAKEADAEARDAKQAEGRRKYAAQNQSATTTENRNPYAQLSFKNRRARMARAMRSMS